MSKQLTDEQIHAVIAALSNRDHKVTGSAVRAELRRLFGVPGSVDRIYRLLSDARTTSTNPIQAHLIAEVATLKHQLEEALKRAELAEYREQTHQEKWVMEIDLLRQQLLHAQVDARKLSEAQNQVLELRRQLHRTNTGS